MGRWLTESLGKGLGVAPLTGGITGPRGSLNRLWVGGSPQSDSYYGKGGVPV